MWDSGEMPNRPELGFDDDGRPVLITTAATSYEEQHRARVRKYLTLMAWRIPSLLLASIAYGIWHNGWVSLVIILVALPLPWMAVLIANDRPPRRPDEPRRYDAAPRHIPLFPGPAHLALEESLRQQQPPTVDADPLEPPEKTDS